MRIEQWRDVVGYSGLYMVSDLGRVLGIPQRDANGRIVRKAKMLRSSPRSQSMRFIVTLRKDGKVRTKYVDRLVLAAFVGPIAAGQAVLHTGRDFADNSLCNLSYGRRTRKRRKKWAPGVCILRSDDIVFVSIAQAAECSGIDESGIRRACKSESGRAGGWGWQRFDDPTPSLGE